MNVVSGNASSCTTVESPILILDTSVSSSFNIVPRSIKTLMVSIGDHLSFLHRQTHYASADVGADIDLGVRLDLTARRHRSDEISLLNFLDADFGRLVATLHRAGDADDHDRQSDRTGYCPFGSFLHLSFRLAKGVTHGAFESGEGFVIVVNSGDAVTLGALISRACLGEVDERRRADSIAVLHQLQFLFCLRGVLFL